jgi:hypothetical protein
MEAYISWRDGFNWNYLAAFLSAAFVLDTASFR